MSENNLQDTIYMNLAADRTLAFLILFFESSSQRPQCELFWEKIDRNDYCRICKNEKVACTCME